MKRIIEILVLILAILGVFLFRIQFSETQPKLTFKARLSGYNQNERSTDFSLSFNWEWDKPPVNLGGDSILVKLDETQQIDLEKSFVLGEYYNGLNTIKITLPVNRYGEVKLPSLYYHENKQYQLKSGEGTLYYNTYDERVSAWFTYNHNKKFNVQNDKSNGIGLKSNNKLTELFLGRLDFRKGFNTQENQFQEMSVVSEGLGLFGIALDRLKKYLIFINLIILAVMAPIVDKLLEKYIYNKRLGEIFTLFLSLIIVTLLTTVLVDAYHILPIYYQGIDSLAYYLSLISVISIGFLVLFSAKIINNFDLKLRFCRIYIGIGAVTVYIVMFKSMLS